MKVFYLKNEGWFCSQSFKECRKLFQIFTYLFTICIQTVHWDTFDSIHFHLDLKSMDREMPIKAIIFLQADTTIHLTTLFIKGNANYTFYTE